jgi:hypothetical protein
MALLIVLMIIVGLLLVGQMAMLVLDNVTARSGTFRRTEEGQYCAEEGLNLGRAWVAQQAAASGSVNPTILTGVPSGTGLFADPGLPTDFKSTANKDLCTISSTAGILINGNLVKGLGGICRTIPASSPNANWCLAGAPNCAMYRINLVDDIDEPPPTINPYVDENQAFFIRSECMAYNTNSNPQGLSGALGVVTAATNLDAIPIDQVAFVEVNEAGNSKGYGTSNNSAGAGN